MRKREFLAWSITFFAISTLLVLHFDLPDQDAKNTASFTMRILFQSSAGEVIGTAEISKTLQEVSPLIAPLTTIKASQNTTVIIPPVTTTITGSEPPIIPPVAPSETSSISATVEKCELITKNIELSRSKLVVIIEYKGNEEVEYTRWGTQEAAFDSEYYFENKVKDAAKGTWQTKQKVMFIARVSVKDLFANVGSYPFQICFTTYISLIDGSGIELRTDPQSIVVEVDAP